MSIKLKLTSAFGLTIVMLALICCFYQMSMVQLIDARRWVEHTQLVLERLENLVSLCKDLESGQRGFDLTLQEDFLDAYSRALHKLPAATSQLRTLTIDNPAQQRRLERLEDLEGAKIAFTQRAIEIARSEGIKASAEYTSTRQGKKLMDEIRNLVTEMEDEERNLLQKRTTEAERISGIAFNGIMLGAGVAILLTAISGFAILRAFSRALQNLQSGLDKIGQGKLDHRITTDSKDEFSKLGVAFNEMANKLKVSMEESANQSWLNGGLANLGQRLQGERDMHAAGQKVLSEMSSALGTQHGMFYVMDSHNGSSELILLASYAHHERKSLANKFAIGQGLVGQCALEKQRIVVANIPDDYIRITSGVGEGAPANVSVMPVVFENQVKAVIEQASFRPFTPVQLLYLDQAANNLGVMFNGIEAAQRTEELLRQEQSLSEELQSQQEELTETNRKLEEYMRSLQTSEEELKQQQEELQQTNEELEERTRLQSKQNAELESQNFELEELRQSMQVKAQQLSITSKYKSEFLSNMSHELRTPLNSLLVLSKVLFENASGNLTAKQIEFARTIHSSGTDLLALIDDVLDISKIEAGAMAIDIAEEPLQDVCIALISSLDQLAKDKELELSVEFQPPLPHFVKTDGRRLQQILKNLLSNALKFTQKGTVTLQVKRVTDGWNRDNQVLTAANGVIAFAVTDTGIGIPAEKQAIIFEAFQQGDGTTNRRFGGSGLGLAISREIICLLGGDIQLKSEPGKGSTFTIYLPFEYAGPITQMAATVVATSSPGSSEQVRVSFPSSSDNGFTDDRSEIKAGDRVLLVVQQDPELSKQIISLARSRGFKVLWSTQSKAAFGLVQRFKPDAITLDVGLPDKDGWIFLDRLKRDSTTRHVPVHVISDEERGQQARRLGAFGYSTTPSSPEGLIDMVNQLSAFVSRKERNLLIVEDNKDERQSLEALLEGADVRVTAVSSGHECLKALTERKYDCMILDLGLPDMTGFELLDKIQQVPALADLSVIIHTSRSLTAQEESRLRRNSETIVVKGARSTDRLLDETTLFLHRVESNLPEQKRKILEQLHLKDPLLSGRTVLIVDDDMRHVFAVTSLLEQHDVKVRYAENGQDALKILKTAPGIELVLMDVMMPEMDGFQTMRAIRSLTEFTKLPIIALTAKAMKGDREQCIVAGASDYLSKPVDSDQLLSLMRVWLY